MAEIDGKMVDLSSVRGQELLRILGLQIDLLRGRENKSPVANNTELIQLPKI